MLPPAFGARAKLIPPQTTFKAFLPLLLLIAATALAPAGDLVWTNTSGGNWSIASNWNPNQSPGAGDNAIITNEGSYTVTLDVDVAVASLSLGGAVGTQTFSAFSRTLTLNGASAIRGNGSMGLNSCTVSGTGTLTNLGTLNPNNTKINAGLVNQGLLVYGGASSQGGAFDNQAGAILRVQGNNDGATDLTVANGFTNSGTIELTSVASPTEANLNVTSGTMVNAAGGQIKTLPGTGGARTLGAQLDNRGAVTIDQPLTLSKSSAAHLNSGTISVSGGNCTVSQNGTFTTTGTLTIAAGKTLQVVGGTFNYSSGTVEGAGTLNLSFTTANFTPNFNNAVTALQLNNATLNGHGTVTNAAGQTLAPNNSAVNAGLVNQGLLVYGGANRQGGAFENQAGAVLRVQGNIDGSTDLTVANGFTNSGTIELTSVASPTEANLNVTSGTMVNAAGGQIKALPGTGGARTLGAQLDNRGAVTIDQPLTLSKSSAAHLNSGTISVSGGNCTVSQNGTFTTTGTLTIAAGKTLQVVGGTFNYNSGTVGGAGTLNLSFTTANFRPDFNNAVTTLQLNNATLNGPGAVTNVAGQALIANNCAINAVVVNQGLLVYGGANNQGGAFENQAGAVLRVQGNSDGATDLTVANGFINGGTIELTSAASPSAANLNVTSGTMVNAAGGQINALAGTGGARTLGAQLDNRGTVTIGQPLMLNKGSADHLNSGAIDLSGGNLTLNQSGTTPTLTNTGTINIGSGRTFTVTGGRFDNVAPGNLQGNGTLDVSNSSFINAGSVSPGASPGRMDITGDYTQATNGVMNIEVAGTDAGTNFDLLAVSGVARLTGTLNLQVANGFSAPNGATLRILAAGTRSNQFNTAVSPSNHVLFLLSYLTNGVELVVTNPPMVLNPPSVTLVAGESQLFTVSFGMPPFSFSLASNNSGGSINSFNGLYTAGPIPDVFDTVEVADSQNFTATASVFVSRAAFQVAGHVTDASGAAIGSATVQVLGSAGLVASTDSAGSYTFNQIPRGANITLSVSKPGYTFSPSQSFTNLATDQVADFTGAAILRSISGVVTNASAQGLSGVTVSILQLASPSVTTTVSDATGHFSVGGLPATANYQVQPSKAGSTFSPNSQIVSLLQANAVVNFRATNSFVIRGRLADALNHGLAGASVKFQSAAGQAPATSTTSSGDFTSPLLPAGSYVVTPSLSGFGISPVSQSVLLANSDVSSVNFTGAKAAITLSGRMTNSLGLPQSAVQVTASGGTNLTQFTLSDGSIAFKNLPANLVYTLTPSKANFVFSPPSATFVAPGVDRTQDFLVTPLLPLFGRLVAKSAASAPGFLLMNADGAGQVLLNTPYVELNGFGANQTPSASELAGGDFKLSPNGQKIAFTSPAEGGSALFVMNADGSGRTRLTATNTFVFHPAWLPGSSRLSYYRLKLGGARPGLIIINADGSGTRTLLDADLGDQSGGTSSWSPNGTQLVTHISFSGGSNHVILTLNTNGASQTIATVSGQFPGPAWSPNGDKIAFSQFDSRGTNSIFVMNPNGSGKTQLTFGGRSIHPTWSPDGSMIAYASETSGSFGIFAMLANGALQTRITSGVFPSWGPAPSVPTPSGANVTVTNGASTVTFSNVSAAGSTSIVPAPALLSGILPRGYVSISGANMNFEVSTTASNTGPITLCFSVPNITNAVTFNSLRILHAEGGVLVDRTILAPDSPAPNFNAKTICARVTNLSPFAVVMAVDPDLPIITGMVVDEVGNPLPDITLELGPDAPCQTVSDINGQFAFANLNPGTTYTILPLDERYTFTPPLAVVENVKGTNGLAFVALNKNGLSLAILPDLAAPGHVTLTWPVTRDPYVPEYADSLASNWIPVLETPSIVGDNFFVSVPATEKVRFFRLHKQ
jgi:Tol biopolymer transport system component